MDDWAWPEDQTSRLHYAGLHASEHANAYFDSSCAITQNEERNWWTAKFQGGPYEVEYVVIATTQAPRDRKTRVYATSDIEGAKVYIGDTLCATIR